jgi:hypothetical protein
MNLRKSLAVTAPLIATAVLLSPAAHGDVYHIPGTASPWFAGAAPGSSYTVTFGDFTATDTVEVSAPVQIAVGDVAEGNKYTFQVSGGVANGPDHPLDGPDGHATGRPPFFGGPYNGLSNVRAPLNSLMGVFLSDAAPGTGEPPMPLDFLTTEQLDFDILRPELQQVFFIGDGYTGDGRVQEFIAPRGATRLFVGVMDGYEWNNNKGGFNIGVQMQVPAPAAGAGLAVAGFGLARRRRRN